MDSIDIWLPAGMELNIGVCDQLIEADCVVCSVVKDSGDDPDMTNGIKIFAKARFSEGQIGNITTKIHDFTVSVIAGIGIGKVTLPGLKVAIGEPAINPVPRKMIIDEINKAISSQVLNFKNIICENSDLVSIQNVVQKFIEVELFIPEGEEIAKTTYNPRLGILGGISILGTTGIVEPVSEQAWMDSLDLEISVMSARGFDSIVFTFGNIGEEFVKNRYGIANDKILKTSNYFGYCLDCAKKYGIKKIIVAGHIGKLIKVSAGIFNTHSRIADARMEIIAVYAALEGADTQIIKQIYLANTTQEACQIIEENELFGVYERIVENTESRCKQYVFEAIEIGALLIGNKDECLGISQFSRDFLKNL